MINTNELLNTRSDYPPEKEDENLIAYTLTVTMGEDVHTTMWTDASKDVPECIIKIVNEIKKIASEEKII